MRPFLIALSLSVVASVSALAQTAAPAAEHTTPAAVAAGFRPWLGPATPHARPLAGGLWYPAASAGVTTLLFDSPVFQGVPVQPEAAIQPGRWPLVLLSHGVGGHWRSLAWLGAGLAQQGAIVVGVNHPGSTFGDYDIRRSLDHGSRVNDLNVTLDTLLADTALAGHIDHDRIYAAGFSLGGWTALSIGGLRGDLQAYARYCAKSGHRHCNDIARTGVDLAKWDADIWNRHHRNPRIKAVAAIDPALHQGLNASHARDVVDKILLIGLGQGADRLPDTDFSGPGTTLSTILPQAQIAILAPAFHFSALPVCKPAGPQLLAEDKDDPVCTDPTGTDRPALHREISRRIGQHFGLVQRLVSTPKPVFASHMTRTQ